MQYEGKVDMSDSRYQIVPCGQCIGCRIERSRQWMVRIMHEAQLFEHNCFLTLTFDDEHLPTDGSLSVRDLQLFMKLLRKHNKGFEPVKDEKTGKITFPIRFFACGEYGSLNERPHYHLIIFNWQPDDMVLRGVNKFGNKLYTSPKIMQYWDKGFNTVGTVTEQSAGYVAKYCIKKVTGSAAEEHYRGRLPEFIVMSRRPGIAARWFDKYQEDIYNYDECILHGTKYRVPRYYDKLYDDVNPCKFAQVKANRLLKAQKFAGELLNSYRLSIKELKTKLYLEKRERNVVSC
uniref:Replication-associated protein n=1 Tax=Cressdnaviricota sp. TaxID=2748378 RepID=A0A6M3YPC4_9VIRU|nr:MAG: replication-associated protein [Cressdnaviricota sp.]